MGKPIVTKIGNRRKLIILEEKRCDECNNLFQPKTVRSAYCSEGCIKKAANRRYKDKTRHGGAREELIKKYGLVCSNCGKVGNRSNIHAHHTSFDTTDHEGQVLLCRSCHSREHKFGESNKSIPKICVQCGEKFTAKTTRQKYCSVKCNKRASHLREDPAKSKARIKKWKLNNPDKYKAGKKRYYEKHADEINRKNREKRTILNKG